MRSLETKVCSVIWLVVPETQSTRPSATDIPIWIFLHDLEALDLGHTNPLKFIEKSKN
jgi:hypothetical protein